MLFFILFIPCFRMGKAHGWGTFQKCGTMLDYCLILGPFDFWNAPHLEAYPTWNSLWDKKSKDSNIFPSVGEHPYLEHFNRVAWDSAHHTCNSSCNHWWRNPGHRYTHWLTSQQIDLRRAAQRFLAEVKHLFTASKVDCLKRSSAEGIDAISLP